MNQENNEKRFCINCGAVLDSSDDGFCVNCGIQLPRTSTPNNNTGYVSPEQESGGFFNEMSYCKKNGYSAEIKMSDWFKLYALNLLPCIPIVGGIALLVVYLMLAFKKNVAKSLQNYVRVSLIISAIAVVVYIIIAIFFISTISSVNSLLGY